MADSKGLSGSLDAREIGRLIKKYLKDEWSKLDFEQTSEKSENGTFYKITANINLNNHDDDIFLKCICGDNGKFYFEAVFDKIVKTKETLALLNQFNAASRYFRAYIREDAFLVLCSDALFAHEEDFPVFMHEVMLGLANLAHDNLLQTLTSITE